MSELKSQSLLLGLMSLTTGVFLVTTELPQQDILMSGLAVFLVLLSLTLERVLPFRRHWNQSQGDVGGDVTMAVLLFGMLDSLLAWMTPFALLMVLGSFTEASRMMPLWLEILVAGVMIELGAWVSHWLHHRSRVLWPFHAMHHSPVRLYTLNNFRFHPLNHVANHLFMIVPVLLLGISTQAILGYTFMVLPVLLLQHTNVDFRFGWLNALLNTNQVHRWHHSAAVEHRNVNLGRATVLFDRLFRTYHSPGPELAPPAIGMSSEAPPYPVARRLFAQLCHPCCQGCCGNSAS